MSNKNIDLVRRYQSLNTNVLLELKMSGDLVPEALEVLEMVIQERQQSENRDVSIAEPGHVDARPYNINRMSAIIIALGAVFLCIFVVYIAFPQRDVSGLFMSQIASGLGVVVLLALFSVLAKLRDLPRYIVNMLLSIVGAKKMSSKEFNGNLVLVYMLVIICWLIYLVLPT